MRTLYKNLKSQGASTALVYLNGGLILAAFFYWTIPGLNNPLWWDEINSFLFYSLQDTRQTLTSLKTANNHIFFNYVMNVFSDKIKIRDINEIVSVPYKFRFITFLSSLLTVLFTYLTGRRIGGKTVGLIATVTLVTTIPFLNYSLQLRGYGFSMLFLSAALYFIFSYEEKGRVMDMLMIPVSIFLLWFTLLSNLYVIVCIGLVVFIQLMLSRFNKKPAEEIIIEAVQQAVSKKGKVAHKKVEKKARTVKPFHPPYGKTILLVGLGMILALLRYLPAWDDFLYLNKAQLSALAPYRSYVIAELLPSVLIHFLAFRYLILLIIAVGLGLIFKKSVRDQNPKTIIYILYFAILLLVPFVLSFINNNYPFDRSFVVLIPVFAVWVGLFTDLVLSSLQILIVRKEIISLILILYAVSTAFVGNQQVQSHLASAIRRGEREQNLTYNYYLSDLFSPVGQMARLVKTKQMDTKIPIISFDDVDMIALTSASNLQGIKYFKMNWEKAMDTTSMGDQRLVKNVADYWESTKENNVGYKTWQLQYQSNLADKNTGMKILVQYLTQKQIMTNKFYAVTAFPGTFSNRLKTLFPSASIKALEATESYNNFYEVLLH